MGTKSPVSRLGPDGLGCGACEVGQLCLASGSDAQTLEQLDGLRDPDQSIDRGQSLVDRGARFKQLFVVRKGCFKSFRVDRHGRERITDFYFPGELVGLDAIGMGVYRDDTVAVTDSAVCTLDYDSLVCMSSCSAPLQRRLFRLFSNRLLDSRLHAGDFSAEERVAAFLVDISARLRRVKSDTGQFELVMSRGDIGSFLGLATETVSRVFTRLSNAQLIHVRRRHVSLLERDRLEQIAEAALGA